MPYKEKKSSSCSVNPRKKDRYKVTNWTEYNLSLKKRGQITLYFPHGDLKSQFINDYPYVSGLSGQQSTYKAAYIDLIYTFYRLFDWGIRQMTGYFTDLWQTKGVDIPVPSFGHLSDLFSQLPIEIRQFCDKLAKRVKTGEAMTLILDSTGLRFGKASHWYEEKYGKPCKKTPWRKMHLSIDSDMNMHTVEITDYKSCDISMMGALIPESGSMSVEKVIADGAYYSKEGVENLHKKGFPSFRPHHILSSMDIRTRHGTIQSCSTSKIKERFMPFTKNMDMV